MILAQAIGQKQKEYAGRHTPFLSAENLFNGIFVRFDHLLERVTRKNAGLRTPCSNLVFPLFGQFPGNDTHTMFELAKVLFGGFSGKNLDLQQKCIVVCGRDKDFIDILIYELFRDNAA